MYCLFAKIPFTVFFLQILCVLANEDITRPGMDALLAEAKKLISAHGNMTILDASIFDDQIHILVDEIIPTEPSLNSSYFEQEMSKLTAKGHITLVSASSPVVWPPAPLLIRSPSTDSLTKRDFSFIPDKQHRLFGFSEKMCTGETEMASALPANRCVKLTHPNVQSVRVRNSASYGVYVSVFSTEDCSSGLVEQHWQPAQALVCYTARSGDALLVSEVSIN